ncbi:TIGR01777 family oxidoreductase [Corynebacterium sp.]|uniref:TIGR01777 family oxidoreductase n=1 Tax=Corynebacterium sp. TaxID=1720 RepID=UPI0025C22C41|nr:TIGR01777 family oxidoreductase [Corynebacterium sp.]
MTHRYHQHLQFPRQDVWDWHTRPGAVTRLTPGFSLLSVASEASSLKDGTTVLSLPGGVPGLRTWQAHHRPDDFVEGRHFVDECVNPPLRQIMRWRHSHAFHDDDTATTRGTLLTDTVQGTAPGALLDRVFRYRHRQLADDLAHRARVGDATVTGHRTVAVTGATGLVGTRLVALLRMLGHTVVPLSRSPLPHEPDARVWDPDGPSPSLFDGVDTVVHLAGAGIAGRFTEGHKTAVRDSRVGPTRRLAELAAANGDVRTFISASAVGFYGHTRAGRVSERAGAGDGFLAEVVADWEAACRPASDAGRRVVAVRTGLVLAGGSPLLTALSASSRLGGGVLGSGRQHFPWVSVDDLVDVYVRAVLDEGLSGPVNAVGPQMITNAEFTSTLADLQRLRVPLSIPVPAAAPALLLGVQGAEELALADQNVAPSVLERHGHTFRHPTLRAALVHELGLPDE